MILTMDVQCLNGHKGVRRVAEHQAKEITNDLFKKMYVCLECGLSMSLMDSQTSGLRVYSTFLCPIHGPQKREYPLAFAPAVALAGGDVDSPKSIVDSFRCPQCGQIYAVSEILDRHGILELVTRCPNGHRATRYVPSSTEEPLLKKILQRVAYCDVCGLPGAVSQIEERRDVARVYASCPEHGLMKKDVPTSILASLKEAIAGIPPDAIVNAMLVSRSTGKPLAIRSVEEYQSGFRFRCSGPSNGHCVDRIVPVVWTDTVKDRIATALLSCTDCGLLTHILDARATRRGVDFDIVCPIHGVQERSVTTDVFKYVKEREPNIDREPSIVRSLTCQRCNMPLVLRDVENRRGLSEFDLDCRNGHRTKRIFVPNLDQKTLVKIYVHLYQCPECYEPLDLVYAKDAGRESRVVLLCPLHGKLVLDVPPDHAEAMRAAYIQIQAERARPPVEAPEPVPEARNEVLVQPSEESFGQVKVARGCDIIGGKFEYKVKVKNETGYVVTNVTVSIVAFPQDCMEMAGETVKSIPRIEVGGFRSPQFTLFPTKDCVQGKVVATVSYIDFRDQLHTTQVEPCIIRSVCDLLKPSEKTSKEFDLLLSNLTKTNQEQTMDWNARILFTKAEKLLPAKNFHIVDTDEKVVNGDFIGTIRGYAEGKYTGKKVAVVFLISGSETGRQAQVKVDALGEDVAMLPITIDELAESMDSWICLRCGAPFDAEQVQALEERKPVSCRYCSHTLTIGLYLQ
jgi:DNA-directed RNA polymerase subunit RPC12/RpoP